MLDPDPRRELELMLTRRQLFGRGALGLGTAAMTGMLGDGMQALGAEPSTGGLHHQPKAKRVIYLFMSGGPSHHDLWDYKPRMQEMYNKPLPEHVRDGQRITGMTSRQKTRRSARASSVLPGTRTTTVGSGSASCSLIRREW